MILLDTSMKKMPDRCSSCRLFCAESPMYCTAVVGSTIVNAPYKRRPVWCPLHEVTDTDTISRQAAYDTLTECYHHKTDMQHKALAEALNRVPSTSRPQWIPCSERLPEVGAVLITDGNEILIGEYYGDSTWSVDGCDYNPDLEKIAWMPLPEPYHRP